MMKTNVSYEVCGRNHVACFVIIPWHFFVGIIRSNKKLATNQ
jgi:hypothetical protein